jgi:hypothetical protein
MAAMGGSLRRFRENDAEEAARRSSHAVAEMVCGPVVVEDHEKR